MVKYDQCDQLTGHATKKDPVSFWHRDMAAELPILHLPTDFPRSSVYPQKRLRLPVCFNGPEYESLQAFNGIQNETVFQILLATYFIFLHRYTSQDDIIIGAVSTDILQNTNVDQQPFYKPVPLRSKIANDMTGKEWVAHIGNTVQAVSVYSEYPFDRLVEEVNGSIEGDAFNIFQTMLVPLSCGTKNDERSRSGISLSQVQECIRKSDLVLFYAIEGNKLLLQWEYDSSLFQASTMQRMADNYKVLLKNILADPSQSIFRLPILTDAEQHQLLFGWNLTEKNYPKDKCLHQLFETQASKTPDNIAVVFEDSRLTYSELNLHANKLSHHLRKIGVGPNVLVGVYMERSLELAVAIWGILKAGGAYIPLDPSYPNDRLLYMLEDAAVQIVLTQEKLKPLLPLQNHQAISLDDVRFTIDFKNDVNPVVETTSNHLAYVIYTSGSTGRPKGVMISHKSVMNLVEWSRERGFVTEKDRMALKTPFCFDASVWEFFTPLLLGATLVMAKHGGHQNSEYLIDWLISQNITVLQTVPTQLQMLLSEDRFGSCTSLKYVFCGGEVLPVDTIRQFFKTTGAELVNVYGPTEACVDATYYVCRADDNLDQVPVGRPIANTKTYILDGRLQPVPIGVVGELFIGGEGLSKGYFNQPKLTADRFIHNPFSDQLNARLYRTGDLARYFPDGTIGYVGRDDHQVKIHGYRIELEEIEAVIKEYGIRNTLVTAVADQTGNHRLVAYVTMDTQQMFDEKVLRDYLGKKLPSYMLPYCFVVLDAFPLLPHGKIDRRALPIPDIYERHVNSELVTPRSPVEMQLARIWLDVLNIKDIGIDDNFFEMGGHSLLATQVMARVRDVFKIELSLTDFFIASTIRNLSEKIENERSKQADRKDLPGIRRLGKKEAPLSFPQDQVAFLTHLAPDNRAYAFQTTIHFSGTLDIPALEHALKEIVRRHEIFRTTFHIKNGHPTQCIHASGKAALPVEDLFDTPSPERLGRADAILADELDKPFNIEQLPLIRWKLMRIEPEEHILIHIEHHLVHDGWSVAVFMKELKILYSAFSTGRASPLEDMPIQFSDYAIWQKKRLQGTVLESLSTYWKTKLQAPLPVINLPTDHPRPSVPSFKGEQIGIDLPGDLSDKLREVSRREGTTLFITMLTAFYVLLYRYTNQQDLIVGTGVANRRLKETEELIGMLVNTIVLRADLSANMTFGDLLTHVKKLTLEAYAFQEMPFGKLVEIVSPGRDLSRNPIFQVLFSFHDSQVPEMIFPDVVGDIQYQHNKTAKFDLNIVTIPWAEQRTGTTHQLQHRHITMKWEYATDLFQRSTIERMTQHYQKLLSDAVHSPGKKLFELSILSAVEQHQLLVNWNSTHTAYPNNQSIHQLFEAQASHAPDQTAVVCNEHKLSYGELNAKANQVAHHLQRIGVGPEALIGLCMERSLETVIGMLAILKAGGAYVPLDPSYPEERLAFMMADTQIKILLTQEHLLSKLPKFEGAVLCLGKNWETMAAESTANLDRLVTGDNLAYVMYTSGSTGRPKGVSVIHRGVVRLVINTNYVEITERDVLLQFAPISFDASTFEIWGALLNGARLVLFPGKIAALHELGNMITRHSVTTVWLTAGLFHEMVAHHLEGLRTVKQLLAGGDVLSPHHVGTALTALKGCRLINGYGPTENTTFTCCHVMTAGDQIGQNVSIGRPISNTQVYMLDDHLQPVPIGVVGELYIGGDGLARGYFNRPELTAAKFISNPFSSDPGSPLYKTGDLARYNLDGTIEFLGRKDRQIKIRGYRIEPGEIEAVLETHPEVKAAAVKVWEQNPDNKRLLSYLVAATAKVPAIDSLRGFLQEKIPDYMMPSAFIWLDSLPLMPSGKVDREALPAPAPDQLAEKESFVAPRDALEIQIAKYWEKVLASGPIGIKDNFFDLGGHSLLVMQVLSLINKLTGKDIPVATFFKSPTVEQLSDIIRSEGWASPFVLLRPFHPMGTKPIFFSIFIASGDAANLIDPEQPFYGGAPHGFDGKHIPSKVEEIAADFVKEIRIVQPAGPYFIGGYSFGGMVSFEIAYQLQNIGQPIGGLILIDPTVPSEIPGPIMIEKFSGVRWFRNIINLAGRIRRRILNRGFLETKIKLMVCLLFRGMGLSVPLKLRNFYSLQMYKRISKYYMPQSYKGKAFLIKSTLDFHQTESFWQNYITEDLEIHEVPGRHLDMFKDPYAHQILAQEFKKCLNKAQFEVANKDDK
ncbi:MAG: amino acid adenylation domain-containing protein [Pseudomonadota bacterium]